MALKICGANCSELNDITAPTVARPRPIPTSISRSVRQIDASSRCRSLGHFVLGRLPLVKIAQRLSAGLRDRPSAQRPQCGRKILPSLQDRLPTAPAKPRRLIRFDNPAVGAGARIFSFRSLPQLQGKMPGGPGVNPVPQTIHEQTKGPPTTA